MAVELRPSLYLVALDTRRDETLALAVANLRNPDVAVDDRLIRFATEGRIPTPCRRLGARLEASAFEAPFDRLEAALITARCSSIWT